jgi:hypothetical protein
MYEYVGLRNRELLSATDGLIVKARIIHGAGSSASNKEIGAVLLYAQNSSNH